MEQSDFGTLKSSELSFTFPPHRPRPLRSETYRTLVRILSHCHVQSQCSRDDHAEAEQLQGSGSSESKQADEGKVHHEFTGPPILEPESLSIERDVERAAIVDFQDRGFDQIQVEIDGEDHVNEIKENNGTIHNNSSSSSELLEKRNPVRDTAALARSQKDTFTIQEIHREELGNVGQLELEMEYYNSKVTEACNSSLHMDVIAGSSKLVENNGGKSSSMEGDVLEEVEHEMQQKGLELDKTVPHSGAIISPFDMAAGEEIEEGQISGDFGAFSPDLLLEDAVSLEQKKASEEQISKDSIDNKGCIFEERKGTIEEDTDTSFVNLVNDLGISLEGELRDIKSQMVASGKTIETKKAKVHDCDLDPERNKRQDRGAKKDFDSPAMCLENATSQVKTSGENASEDQGIISTKKDVGVNKKRRRGPETKEKKEKKKAKKRIKRAEKNRKLGVKRLKLQPVSKPKIITYCCHYLKGRCQEGAKCKFSHDTTPLTKSKPCCYFARHACMKGDDCPFDHQLSKYPCNNYLSNGYCSRGADCLFSHEMPQKEGFQAASNVSKPELKSICSSHNSKSTKQPSNYGTCRQNIKVNSCSVEISQKETGQNVLESMLKPTTQPPKGVNFLLFGKSSMDASSQSNQAGSPRVGDDAFKVGNEMIHAASHTVGNSSISAKTTAGMTPKGVNFLSFGKAPLCDSSNKKLSGLLLDGDNSRGKSLLGNSNKDKETASSLNQDDVVKIFSQNASDIVQNMKEFPKRIDTVAPLGTKSLSFGTSPFEDSSYKKQASLLSYGNNDGSSTVQGRTSASNKLQIPCTMPLTPTPSLPLGQSLRGLTDGHVKSPKSSTQLAVLSSTSNTAPHARQSNTPSSSPLQSNIPSSSQLQSNIPSSSQKTIVSNAPSLSHMAILSKPSSTQRALLSTLAFAAKYESRSKTDQPVAAHSANTDFDKKTGISRPNSSRASTILDFLYSDGTKTTE